jgi:hypothetical protein
MDMLCENWLTPKLLVSAIQIHGLFNKLKEGMGATPIEAIAMVHLIRYLKKIEQMEDSRWPKVIFNDILCKRKKTWMRQNIKWLNKWDIHLNRCPMNSKEIKDFVIDMFHK